MSDKIVAVFGLGSMGSGIAQSLLRGGLDVVGQDIYPPSRQKLIDAGGRVAERDEALAQADVIVLSLLNEEQVRAALFDENDSPRAMKPGAVVICTSTVSIGFIQWVEAALAAIGVGVLDAPVSGGPARAASGELATYLSGPAEVVARAQFVLDLIAKPLIRVGDKVGQGTSLKLVNQLLVAGHLAVGAQALAFAEQAGLDMPALIPALAGSAGDSWVLQNLLPRHVARDYEPRATLALLLKDVRIISQTSRDQNIYNPVIDFVEGLMTQVAQDGREARDGVVVAKYLLEHGRGETA